MDMATDEVKLHIYETMARSIAIDLQGFVWGQNVTEPIEVQVPTIAGYTTVENPQNIRKIPINRWHMFKELFFPKWLKRAFPIEYHDEIKVVWKKVPMKTEQIAVRVIYPKLKLAYPGERHTVRVFTDPSGSGP